MGSGKGGGSTGDSRPRMCVIQQQCGVRWRRLELAKGVPREVSMGREGDKMEDVKWRRDRDKCSGDSRQPAAGTSLTDGGTGLECESGNHTAL